MRATNDFRHLSNDLRLRMARHGFASDLQVGDVLLAESGCVRGIVRSVERQPEDKLRVELGMFSWYLAGEIVRFIRPKT